MIFWDNNDGLEYILGLENYMHTWNHRNLIVSVEALSVSSTKRFAYHYEYHKRVNFLCIRCNLGEFQDLCNMIKLGI